MPKCPKCNRRYVHERCFNCDPVMGPRLKWFSVKLTIDEVHEAGCLNDALPKGAPTVGFSHNMIAVWEPTMDSTYMAAFLTPQMICEEYGFRFEDQGPDGTALVREVADEDYQDEGCFVLTGIHTYSSLPPAPNGFHLQYEERPGGIPLWRYTVDHFTREVEVFWREKAGPPPAEVEGDDEDRDATPMELLALALDEMCHPHELREALIEVLRRMDELDEFEAAVADEEAVYRPDSSRGRNTFVEAIKGLEDALIEEEQEVGLGPVLAEAWAEYLEVTGQRTKGGMT